jgi:2-polyprenyl-3-methyl-5-hydroxy-6-metoxy-1,4-benzoquinol methylase
MRESINQLLLINTLFNKLNLIRKNVTNKFRSVFHIYDSENKLAADSQDYWDRDYFDKSKLAQDAHWKNKGIFENQQRWLSIGKQHLDLILKYSSVLNLQFPVKQIVEWGCGGGANAVHLAPLTDNFVGIDIASDSLVECKKQVSEIGLNNFQPVLINAVSPETVLKENLAGVDLFICTYVFELFPSPKYGLNVLNLANKMLSSNGIAFIHIRYNDVKKELKSKRWGYKLHPYIMTTYTLEEFWESSKECGFEPLGIYLTPKQPLVNDSSTAYFFLKKKA